MTRWFILQIMLILNLLLILNKRHIVKDKNITTAIQIFQSCFEK